MTLTDVIKYKLRKSIPLLLVSKYRDILFLQGGAQLRGLWLLKLFPRAYTKGYTSITISLTMLYLGDFEWEFQQRPKKRAELGLALLAELSTSSSHTSFGKE